MFNHRIFENSRADGVGVLEIVDEADQTGDSQTVARRFVPLERTELTGEIVGPVAALRLTHIFEYTAEQCPRVLEAVYRFPLPGDAAVTGVCVRFGEVEIRAELAERADAERRYADARAEGRQASLLTRESPDVFTLQVAGIRPDQAVTVETSYVQLARAEGAGWSLRVPLTTSPRYVRSDELATAHAHGQPLALLRDPGHRFALDLVVEGADAVTSATHRLDVTAEADRLRVRLADHEVVPDRDCVLTWRPGGEPDRASLRVLLHDESESDQVYFLALVAPPAEPTPAPPTGREVIVLVDHSGSMEGPKWAAADWAVKKFLAELTPRDTFNLGLFHDTTRWLAPAPLAADDRALDRAVTFLDRHRDSGGTELGVALEQALSQERTPGERARHVLIVTDAEVSDLGRILHLAEQDSRRPDRRRISVLCIDAAPNSLLALELAERGGGLARFLTSSPDEGDITTALDEVLADWAAPVLTGLRLSLNRPGVQAAGREVRAADEAGWSDLDLGDLPTGRAVWVAGRARRGTDSDLTFRLRASGGRDVAEWRPGPSERRDRRAVMALFGGRRVLDLELLGSAGLDVEDKLRRLGYDPAEVLAPDTGHQPIYAENVRARSADGIRKLLVREALRFGLACSETAFVAERTVAGQRVEATVAVANALPHGWSDMFLSAPLMADPMMAMSPPPMPASGSAPTFMLAEDVADDLPPLRWAKAARRRLSRGRRQAPAAPTSAPAGGPVPPPSTVIFDGVPAFAGGEAILLDSSRDGHALPDGETIGRLTVRFPDGVPAPDRLDPGLTLLVFVDDPTTPRARARLADVVRQGGERPLNILRRPGQHVRIVLLDPNGAWSSGAPRIEVALG